MKIFFNTIRGLKDKSNEICHTQEQKDKEKAY